MGLPVTDSRRGTRPVRERRRPICCRWSGERKSNDTHKSYNESHHTASLCRGLRESRSDPVTFVSAATRHFLGWHSLTPRATLRRRGPSFSGRTGPTSAPAARARHNYSGRGERSRRRIPRNAGTAACSPAGPDAPRVSGPASAARTSRGQPPRREDELVGKLPDVDVAALGEPSPPSGPGSGQALRGRVRAPRRGLPDAGRRRDRPMPLTF
jgi:hypothetical protein